jgi:translocation and assembly module TamB
MRIKGSFSHPKLILSSDPPLSKEQILNLVMTGASPEEIEKSSELFPAVQVAYYATASIFKPIETKLEKTLGLENFSVEPYITKYGETVAKFTISKRLFKRFRITGYETTGQKPEYGGSLQFFLNDKYFLETRYNSYYGIETGIGFDINVR